MGVIMGEQRSDCVCDVKSSIGGARRFKVEPSRGGRHATSGTERGFQAGLQNPESDEARGLHGQ
jgi:hypothetical protein